LQDFACKFVLSSPSGQARLTVFIVNPSCHYQEKPRKFR
jgi:hypothetical protein